MAPLEGMSSTVVGGGLLTLIVMGALVVLKLSVSVATLSRE
jgi:hypothetical protein